MKQINTKFGTIYIEDLEYDRHCPAMREEEDRIKVFDSLERYLDYWTIDTLTEFATSANTTLEAEYQEIIRMYENADSLHNLCPDIRYATNDVEKMALFMQADYALDIEGRDIVAMMFTKNVKELEELVLANDFVNKIGDWYILIEEY
jgi:hypothetical protein